MKHFIVALLITIAGSLLTLSANAQQSICFGQTPTIQAAGHFNGTTVAGGSAYVPVLTSYKAAQLPLYTKLDTLTNTGTDTFKCKLAGDYNLVKTWVHVTGISGTNTSCKVKLYASCDAGFGVDWVAVDSGTVSANNPICTHIFNNGQHWDWTNFKWVFVGAGTQVSSWYGGLHVR